MKRVVFCWLWMTCLVLGLTGCETTHVVPVEGLIPNRGELDKASGYAVEDGPSGIKVKSYFNFSQGHFSEDMYGGVFAFFVDRLPDETEVGFSVNYGVYE